MLADAVFFFFFSSRRRHTRFDCDWSSDVCSSDLPERVTGAALGVGIARYALGAAARYAAERTVWGGPIGTHQGVSHPLAKAKIETELAALMIRQAAWQHDHGQPAGEASNMATYAAAESPIAAVDPAIQVHGGNGLASEYGLIA